MARGHACDSVDVGEAVIVAGIGCRAGASAEQIEAALAAALGAWQVDPPDLQIATPLAKSREPGIIAAAEARSLPLLPISQTDLEAANPRTVTRSEHSMIVMNVHSVAEAAALAGAGPQSRLLGPRIVVGPVTCALAQAIGSTPADISNTQETP